MRGVGAGGENLTDQFCWGGLKLELKISHTMKTDEWIKEHHYLHSTPAGARVRMEFYVPFSDAYRFAQESGVNLSGVDMRDGMCLVGAMMWGRPTSRKIDQKSILELTRCCFLDFMPKNTESRCLAKARAWIRKYLPEVKGLIAYSSTAEGHRGTIYLADGWFKISETESPRSSWETRKGRKNRDLSVKYKFARSP